MHCLALRLRLLPVLAKDLTHPAVMPTALAVELLPLDTGLAVAGLLERALRSLVLHERAGADLVQVQLAKAERGPERHGLGRDALAPKRLVTDGQTGLPVSVPPVDPPDSGEADRSAIHLDHPLHGIGVLTDTVEPLLLLRIGKRAHSGCEAQHVDIFEPALVRRELFLSRRPEGALLAAKDRTEHGRTLSSGSPRSECASGGRG